MSEIVIVSLHVPLCHGSNAIRREEMMGCSYRKGVRYTRRHKEGKTAVEGKTCYGGLMDTAKQAMSSTRGAK
jgi:hypothetical protein